MFDHTSDFNLYNISILNQIWQKGELYEYNLQSRPCWGVCYIISGRIKYITDGKTIIASAGDMVVLKKDAKYKAVFSVARTQDILINFDCAAADGKDVFFDDSGDEVILLKNRFDLKKSFSDALHFYLTGNRLCMVKSVLFGILDETDGYELRDTPIDRIKRMIDETADFKVKESELAKMCMTSVSTFQRTFKRIYGKTFSEYKNELRILKAKELLPEGEYNMEEIAEMLGFCDGAYFSRCFKKHTGYSPKKYININRGVM